VSYLDTLRRLMADRAGGVNSFSSFNSYLQPSPQPTSEASLEGVDSTKKDELTKKAPDDSGVNSFSSFNSYSGWIEVNIPPPPVALRELEVDLRHWPGVPRCAVAELERAGVPREEAIASVRAQYGKE